MKEIWKVVPNYNEYYEVSNKGRVRSYKNHNGGRRDRPKYLKLNPGTKGYITVRLSRGTNEKDIKVHRLVSKLFIPNPENKPQVNHIDGVRHNNNVNNLEWCTQSENTKHAYENGMCSPSTDVQRKLNSDDIINIRNIAKKRGRFYNARGLADEYGVSKTCICDIVQRRTWKDI